MLLTLQQILIFGRLGDLFWHFKCLKVASVFPVLRHFFGTLPGLTLKNQLQGFFYLLSLLLLVTVGFSLEQRFLRFELFQNIRCVAGNPRC